MENPEIDINPEIHSNAVSIYGHDAMDDFPVLKAFQQYIDAEHTKARKRLISLGIFFGCFTGIIIAIFVILLMNVSAKNQALNDRLIEFAMKDRDRGQAAVVVQPPIQQDNSALLAVTAKLEELQRKLTEEEKEKKIAEEQARVEAEKKKGPTAAELEVVRLKALLSAEKEKLAEERKRQKEIELEAYRRKHYPELYAEKVEIPKEDIRPKRSKIKRIEIDVNEADDEDIELDDDDAISYFDELEDAPAAKPAVKPRKQYYSIPVEVRGSRSNWQVPND
jgi:hypothetical protein